MMSKPIYKYTNDTWIDGDENCSWCSELEFECYNAVDWSQNGSAGSMWDLYVNVLAAHKHDPEYYGNFYDFASNAYVLYEGLTLGELQSLAVREGIVLEEVEG